MKIIICGAGNIGYNIAAYLSNDIKNDITVIDPSVEKLSRFADSLDVRTLIGHPSYPSTLKEAGAENTEMIIAVSSLDEINMITCQIAHSLFDVQTKIARIRHQNYLVPDWAGIFSRDHVPIDTIISPEIEIAKAITRQLQAPSSSELTHFANHRVVLASMRCQENSPLLGTSFSKLKKIKEFKANIICLLRGEEDELIFPSDDEQLYPTDDIYFICAKDDFEDVIHALGHEDKIIQKVVIAGGENIGRCLAREMAENHPKISIQLIESNKGKAKLLAQALNGVNIIHGDALDPAILEEVNIANTEAFISVTSKDEVNVLSSVMAKKEGCERTITLLNNDAYESVITNLELDTVISQRNLTVSKILEHVRRGKIRSVVSLRNNIGKIIEADILENSEIIGKCEENGALPKGVKICAILRKDTVILADKTSCIQPKDRVILYAPTKQVKKVEQMFVVKRTYR
ncbi:MAG: Trk system potassium transporter TrkA [Alphaproteobacteria bacterium]